MADRLRWWVIPGALVVLVRVVTLGVEAENARDVGFVAEASAPLGETTIAEANGPRLRAMVIDTAGAAMLRFPTAFAGQRGDMVVWRREGGRRASEPWLVLRPRVRDDGTLPFAGLDAGHYDFEFRVDGVTLIANDAAVPGDVSLSAGR